MDGGGEGGGGGSIESLERDTFKIAGPNCLFRNSNGDW